MLTFLILQRIRYGPKPSHIGIGKLLNRGAYGAAFPLHDGPKDPDYVEKSLPIRNKLWSQWSEMKNIFKFQPLDTIRGYFGEKIGLCTGTYQPIKNFVRIILLTLLLIPTRQPSYLAYYFAWLGFYTTWLIFPTILGLITFFYGIGERKIFPVSFYRNAG